MNLTGLHWFTLRKGWALPIPPQVGHTEGSPLWNPSCFLAFGTWKGRVALRGCGKIFLAECVGPSQQLEQQMSWEETLSAEQTSAQHVWKACGNFHHLGCPQPTFHYLTVLKRKRETAFVGFILLKWRQRVLAPNSSKKIKSCNSAKVGEQVSSSWRGCFVTDSMRLCLRASTSQMKLYFPALCSR